MCSQPRGTAARITGKGGKWLTGVGGTPLAICCSNTGNKERFVDKQMEETVLSLAYGFKGRLAHIRCSLAEELMLCVYFLKSILTNFECCGRGKTGCCRFVLWSAAERNGHKSEIFSLL